MPCMRALFVSVIVCGACHDPAPPPPQQPTTDGSADPALAQDREDFITDAVAFTGLPRAVVIEKSKAGNTSLKDEWNEWEKQGPMTDDRIKAFYKQTVNYLFDLAGWHLWMADKRASDVEFVEEMKKSAPKNI